MLKIGLFINLCFYLGVAAKAAGLSGVHGTLSYP